MLSGLGVGCVRTLYQPADPLLESYPGQQQVSFHLYPGGGSKANPAKQQKAKGSDHQRKPPLWDLLPGCLNSLLELLLLHWFEASLGFLTHLEEPESLILLFLPHRRCSRCLGYTVLKMESMACA